MPWGVPRMFESRNRLIDGLAEVHEHLRPHAATVVVPAGRRIYAADQEVDRIFLIDAGIAALAWPDEQRAIDIAIIGRDGMIGAGASFGGPTSFFPVIARTPLTVLQVPAQMFDEVISASPELKARVFAFAKSLVRQIAETAHVNARRSVEQRLARWLTITTERLDAPSMRVTHDEIAWAIGARRAGVTVALHGLEGEKLVRSTRGKVTVLDPRRLANFASDQFDRAGAAAFR
jgi:CRP-like cAMP-binding protein